MLTSPLRLYNVYNDNPPIKPMPKIAGIKNAYWYEGNRECIQLANCKSIKKLFFGDTKQSKMTHFDPPE